MPPAGDEKLMPLCDSPATIGVPPVAFLLVGVFAVCRVAAGEGTLRGAGETPRVEGVVTAALVECADFLEAEVGCGRAEVEVGVDMAAVTL